MKIEIVRSILLFLIVSIGWLPTKASAFCIGWDKSLPNYDPEYYSVSHEFQRAKYVLKARVTRETWLGEDGLEKPLEPSLQNGRSKPGGFDSYIGAYYGIEISRAFKGKPPVDLILFSENSTARFWLDIGQEYLFFVTEDDFGQPIGSKLTIDTCGNSAVVEKAEPALKMVESLSRSK
jgi:hypothetical protein